MKFIFKITVLCVLLLQEHQSACTHIRVLLTQEPRTIKTTWTINCDSPMTVCPLTRQHMCIDIDKHCVVTITNATITLNAKKRFNYTPLKISSTNPHALLTFNGHSYQGEFLIIPYGDKILLINSLDIEQYVLAVLRTESWPGWPLEVNKAFAIASRSYAVAKMLEAQDTQLPYHIKNTNIHQTYKGYHTSAVLHRAVQETSGIVLGHDKKPIVAMFDSCCGGIIPAHLEGVDFKKAPYLARTQACTFCKTCSVYSWKKEIPKNELTRRFKKEFPTLDRVDSIEITRRDKADTVQEARIHQRPYSILGKSPLKAIVVDGKKLYSLLPEVKSFCYTVDNKRDSIVVTGQGYGHHIGLCQWGARQMINAGWDFHKILTFFYPGASFMRIKL